MVVFLIDFCYTNGSILITLILYFQILCRTFKIVRGCQDCVFIISLLFCNVVLKIYFYAKVLAIIILILLHVFHVVHL